MQVLFIWGPPYRTEYKEKGHPHHEQVTWGGQGDLVSRLRMGINGVTIWVVGVINLLIVLSLPDPPSTGKPGVSSGLVRLLGSTAGPEGALQHLLDSCPRGLLLWVEGLGFRV